MGFFTWTMFSASAHSTETSSSAHILSSASSVWYLGTRRALSHRGDGLEFHQVPAAEAHAQLELPFRNQPLLRDDVPITEVPAHESKLARPLSPASSESLSNPRNCSGGVPAGALSGKVM